MADLLPFARQTPTGIATGISPVVTSEAPQNHLSGADVAGPYQDLAKGLNAVGEGLSDIAVPFAEHAGAQAVSRDDNGNLVVQHAPIVGPAGAAYARAAKFTAVAEASGESRRADIAMSKQYQDNPDAYAKAAGAFRDNMVQKYSEISPEVGAAVGKQIDSQTTFNYRSLVNQHQRLTSERFIASSKAEIQSNTDDLLSYLRSGGDENDPQSKRLLNNIVALTHERVNNPAIAYPPEVAAADLKSIDLQIGAQKVLHQVDTIMADPKGGATAAMDYVDGLKKDQTLTPLQQQFYASEGEKTIRATTQDDSRRATIAAKNQKAADENFETSVIKDSATADPKITPDDIKTMQGVSPESKMRMLAWLHRDGAAEPLAQTSHTASVDLFRRMNLPDGDPNKITDAKAVREAYAPLDGSAGSLNRADEEWLEKRLTESRTATGERLTDMRKQFGASVTPLIDKSNPLMGRIDQTGKLQNYQFERFVDQKIDEYKAANKSPFDLFDPTKPDYLGKPEIVQHFQKSLSDTLHDLPGMMGQRANVPLPAPPGGVRGAANVATPGSLWGNPGSPSFASEHLTSIQSPSGASAQVNKVSAPAFQGFLRELEQSGYKVDTVQGYNDRHIAGSTAVSQHAYGNAIDINPDRNQVGFGLMKTDMPPDVGAMAAKYGISWGGDWKNKKDPMHFEYVGGGDTSKANDMLRQPNETVSQYLGRVSGKM
jgi:hypothetical protein